VRVVVIAAVALAVAGAARATPGIDIFRTPSGNIGCVYGAAGYGQPAYLRCDIRSGLVPKPAKPRGCDLDYGDSYGMRKHGRPSVTCHGDTALDPHAKVLAYGTVWARDGYRCSSQTTGLKCSNLSGHGFFLSREHSYTF
jgi:hypothetical protein